jgi:uncharacterized membrane protein
MTVAMLSLAGIFVALYLLLYKLGMIGHLTCSIGSCETVNTSRWATFLGIPVAGWGVAFYIGMFALAITSTGERYADSVTMSRAIVGMAGTGVVFSAWLTYLELFRIHAICQWCVISAIIVTILFIVAVLDLKETAGLAEESSEYSWNHLPGALFLLTLAGVRPMLARRAVATGKALPSRGLSGLPRRIDENVRESGGGGARKRSHHPGLQRRLG